jgi:hypothetical protein
MLTLPKSKLLRKLTKTTFNEEVGEVFNFHAEKPTRRRESKADLWKHRPVARTGERSGKHPWSKFRSCEKDGSSAPD